MISLLYASEDFGISLGYQVSLDGDETKIEWVDPMFYRQATFGRQTITRLPHNAFHLIQNLELNFADDAMASETAPVFDFLGRTSKLLRHIKQICANLEESFQLQRFDVNLSFCCKFDDIGNMVKLLEPIKKLRGISHPSITVCGYHFPDIVGLQYPTLHQGSEPRWGLTDEFSRFMQGMLMSPHGSPMACNEGIEVFEDDYENLEVTETNWRMMPELSSHNRRWERLAHLT